MSEALAAERWIHRVLVGDPALRGLLTDPDGQMRVFRGAVPQGRAFPSVLYACEEQGTPVYAQPCTLCYLRFAYRVWAVLKGPGTSSLEPIRDRVYDLLQGGSSERVLLCQRVRTYAPEPAVESGVTFARLGDVFELWVR